MILYGIFFYSPVNVWFYYALNPWYMKNVYGKLLPKIYKNVKLGDNLYSMTSLFTQKYIVIWAYIPGGLFTISFIESYGNLEKSV